MLIDIAIAPFTNASNGSNASKLELAKRPFILHASHILYVHTLCKVNIIPNLLE